MQQLSSWGEVVDVGSRDHPRMDQARVLVDACMHLESEIPLVALPRLVHLWIPLAHFVLGGAGCSDQGGINDRALSHRHASSDEVILDGLIDEVFCKAVDLLTKLMLLQQVAERENRGLVRDSIADQLDASKAAHGGNLNQSLLHGWVAERIPLLQQVDPQHRRQWVWGPTAFLAGLGVVGLDQGDQRLPGHHRLHLSEELLSLGLLLGCGELVVREAGLLAAHHPSPGMRSQGHCPAGGVGFPESP